MDAGDARLFGRRRELQALAGTLGGLIVEGEPGIGKTSLLDATAAERRARGARTVRLTAAARGGRPLEELLAALDEHRPGDAAPLDRAVLETLRSAVADRPTLLVVDDAHHLDVRSWHVLIGAQRMLHEHPLTLIMAALPGDDRVRLSGVPVLTLAPLDRRASVAVVAEAAPDGPAFVRERVLEAADGNPLALSELARAPVGDWQRTCVRAPVALPLSRRLMQAFSDPVHRLPLVTQKVLLAAAANDSDSFSEAAQATALALEIPLEQVLGACLVALEHGVITGGPATLQFRAEVVRSAVYQSASLRERHAMHQALWTVVGDPLRRAWHRAAVSLAPDEALARELEAAGNAFRRRGQLRDALANLDRSIRVSQDDDARGRRLFDATEIAFEIGRPDFARAFTEQFAGLAGDAAHARPVRWLRELYELWRPDGPEGVTDQLRRAEAAFADDGGARTRAALTRAVDKAEVCTVGTLPEAEVRATADRLGGLARTPALAGVLAVALPLEHGPAVLETIGALPPDAGGDPRLARLLGEAAALLGHDTLALRSLSAAIDQMRAEERLGILAFAYIDRSRSHLNASGLGPARQDADEAARLALETRQPVLLGRARALQALLEGIAGHPDVAHRHADEAERLAMGRPALLLDVYLARGLIELVCEEHEAAYSWLRHLWSPTAPVLAIGRRRVWFADLAEAALVSGDGDAVRPWVDALARDAAVLPSPALRAAVTRARAVLSDAQDTEALYQAALAAAAEHGPLSTGRAQLAYGTWLRRRRRVSHSRLALRAAVAAFGQVGAGPWAERAVAELRAAGGANKSAAPGVADLTAQELEIAELAAGGLTNREIGSRLYLSPRTISTHLYRVFPKLGITSRAQLRDAIGTRS